MGKITGKVIAKLRETEVIIPVAYMPVASPACSIVNQALMSLGKLGYTKAKPTPKRDVNANRVSNPVEVPRIRLPIMIKMAPIPAAFRMPILSASKPLGMAIIANTIIGREKSKPICA